jgi:hypothetical protein
MIRTFEQSSNRLWVSQGFSLGPLSARRAEGATALPKASFTVEQSSTGPQTGAKRPEYTQKPVKPPPLPDPTQPQQSKSHPPIPPVAD